MPASAPAPGCGSSWPGNTSLLLFVAGVLLITSTAWFGCDGDDGERKRIAEQRAELQARYHGEVTVMAAREIVLLHPASERQRQAREQLLFLEQHQDQFDQAQQDVAQQDLSDSSQQQTDEPAPKPVDPDELPGTIDSDRETDR